MTLIVMQSEPDVDLLHVLEIKLTDSGDVLLTEHIEDAAGHHVLAMLWPVDRIEAVAVALLAAARDARMCRPLIQLLTPARETVQ